MGCVAPLDVKFPLVGRPALELSCEGPRAKLCDGSTVERFLKKRCCPLWWAVSAMEVVRKPRHRIVAGEKIAER
jgi:hypothetical protein